MADYALPDLVSRLKIDTSGFAAGLEAAGALIAVAAAGIAAFAITAVEKTTAAGQAAYEMSAKFGLAKDAASAWMAVGLQLGVSGDTIGTGFKFLAKNVEAMNLTLEAHKKIAPVILQAYKDLGLNVFDASGKVKDANELMLEAADAFAKMPDGIEKTALAVKLFGRSGSDLIPVLNLGRQGIEDMMNAGKAAGTVMSGAQVDAAHKLFLEQQKLTAEITGFTMQLGEVLMPLMQTFIDWLTGTAVPGIVAFAKPIEAQLIPALQNTAKEVQNLIAWGEKHKTQLEVVAGIIAGLLTPALIGWSVVMATQAYVALIQFIASLGELATVSLLNYTRIGLSTIAMVAQAIAMGAVRVATMAWTAAQWLLNLALDANPIGLVIIAIGLLVAGFVYAYNNIKPFRDFINAMWDDLKRFAAWVQSTLSPIIGGIGSAFSSIGGEAHSLHIPGFAMGGVVPGAIGAASLAVVHGGETITPPGGMGPSMSTVEGLLAQAVSLLAELNGRPALSASAGARRQG